MGKSLERVGWKDRRIQGVVSLECWICSISVTGKDIVCSCSVRMARGLVMPSSLSGTTHLLLKGICTLQMLAKTPRATRRLARAFGLSSPWPEIRKSGAQITVMNKCTYCIRRRRYAVCCLDQSSPPCPLQGTRKEHNAKSDFHASTTAAIGCWSGFTE